MHLNLQNSFADRECMQYFLLNFKYFPSIGWHISQIFTILFQKAASRCLLLRKKFCPNLRNGSTYRKNGIALYCLPKSLANSKGFGVKWPRTFQINIIIKVELKNSDQLLDRLLSIQQEHRSDVMTQSFDKKEISLKK
jgi:hypothetical protein